MAVQWSDDFELITKTVNNTNPQSYVDLYNLMPPTRYTANPVITHGATYINICPAGWIVDPANSSNFILYVGQFTGNVDVGARIAYYTGARSNPYSLSYGGVAIDLGTTGDPDEQAARFGSVVVDAGTIYYYYVGVNGSNLYQVCVATSTNGTSFTKHGAILTPDGVNEDGFTDPNVMKVGSTWYMYVTRRDVTTMLPTAIVIASSTTPLSGWAKTGVTALSLGATNSADGKYIEGGQLAKFGNDYVLIYNAASASDIWTCCIAHSDSIGVAMTKEPNNPFFQHNGAATGSDTTGVATPLVVNNTGTQWVMYYQGSQQTQPASTWDVCIADFTSSVEVNPAGYVVPRLGWTGDTSFWDIEGTVALAGTRSCRGLNNTALAGAAISHAIDVYAGTSTIITLKMQSSVTAGGSFWGGWYVFEGANAVAGVYFYNGGLYDLQSTGWVLLQAVSPNTQYNIELDVTSKTNHTTKVNTVIKANNVLHFNAISNKLTSFKLEKSAASATLVYFDSIVVNGTPLVLYRRGFGARVGSRE